MDFNAILTSINEALAQLMALLEGAGLPVDQITAFFSDIIGKIVGLFA